MSDARTQNGKANHDVVLLSREKLTINGIKEIINFDEEEINFKTICGELTITGKGLHINILDVDLGESKVVGKINSITYFDSQNNEKHSLLSKIFK